MTKKIKLQISGMHCVSCAFNIDSELEEIPGVKESYTNYAKSETEIVIDSDKINDEILTDKIEHLGYQAKVTENRTQT